MLKQQNKDFTNTLYTTLITNTSILFAISSIYHLHITQHLYQYISSLQEESYTLHTIFSHMILSNYFYYTGESYNVVNFQISFRKGNRDEGKMNNV
jgi:hypothetical protein